MKLSLFFSVFTLASAAVITKQQTYIHAGAAPAAPKQSLVDVLEKKKQNHTVFEDGVFRCGVTKQVTDGSERGKLCPDSCPLFVQDKTDAFFCSFRCVEHSIQSCKTWNPAAPVPDVDLGVCRACEVSGCHSCSLDGTDTCLECKSGQALRYGKCYNLFKYFLWIIIAVIVSVVMFIVCWIYSLTTREVTNTKGLDQGLLTRSAAKLHMPQDEEDKDQPRELWPLTTNLLTTPVAGNGILHLFNFQFILIVWASVTLFAWWILGHAVDTDLFRLGTRSPGETPRDNCIIIAWGFNTQQRLMWHKYMFVLAVYIFSFLGAVFYSMFQLRRHQKLDDERTSHKDFCAKLTGLPRFSGKERVETELCFLMKETLGEGSGVLGVSVCWDYGEKEDTLMKVISEDTEERSNVRATEHRTKAAAKRAASLENMSHFDTVFAKWENFLMSPNTQKIVKKQHNASAMTKNSMTKKTIKEEAAHDPEAVPEEVDMIEELEQLYTTEDAFIVFETEVARNAAVEKVSEKGGIKFYESTLHLEEAPCEPQTVNWSQIKNRTWLETVLRCAAGFLCIILALAVWCFCFYLPYARSVVKSDYAHGKDPNVLTKTMFGFIVIAGNGMMYVVCAEVSDRVGFKTQAKREVCYMLLYCFSCVFNVLLDLVMAYKMAYKQMVGLDVQTHNGEHLSEVDTFGGRFETYAMQKSLGGILLDYSFPSTFLIPFLIEPIVTIFVPYQIMSLIVRTNPAIVGSAAEAYLSSSPMDLSRYADVLLNLVLCVLMFFFPGGYLWPIMLGLIVSHLVIYAFDHYRVLRSVPACDFATRDVDWWAQQLLSIPCGLLLACAAFKANCSEDAPLHCWEDGPMIYWCCGLFVGHIILHTLILLYVVPMFGIPTEPSQEPYRKCAQQYPCSWFAANPVHCLRSQYIYEHDPPCDYFILGKDHMLRQNPELHCFYVGRTPRKEEFDPSAMYSDVSGKLKDASKSIRTSLERRLSSTSVEESKTEETSTASPSQA